MTRSECLARHRTRSSSRAPTTTMVSSKSKVPHELSPTSTKTSAVTDSLDKMMSQYTKTELKRHLSFAWGEVVTRRREVLSLRALVTSMQQELARLHSPTITPSAHTMGARNAATPVTPPEHHFKNEPSAFSHVIPAVAPSMRTVTLEARGTNVSETIAALGAEEDALKRKRPKKGPDTLPFTIPSVGGRTAGGGREEDWDPLLEALLVGADESRLDGEEGLMAEFVKQWDPTAGEGGGEAGKQDWEGGRAGAAGGT